MKCLYCRKILGGNYYIRGRWPVCAAHVSPHWVKIGNDAFKILPNGIITREGA